MDMAGQLHDSIKSYLLKSLKSIDKTLFTTELELERQRLDIASRNYLFLVEVEPTQREEETGIKQLIGYARKAREIVEGSSGIHAVLCYHRTARTVSDYFDDRPEELVFKYAYVGEGDILFEEITFEELIKIAKEVSRKKLPLDLRVFAGVVSNIKDTYEDLLWEMFSTYRTEINALYQAYRKEMEKVYVDSTEDTLQRLFVVHTFLNILALSLISIHLKGRTPSVEDLMEVKKGYSLPFLNWAFILYRQGKLTDAYRTGLQNLVEEICHRLSYFEWRVEDLKDVFRLVYEEFIREEERRRLGEYYTPLWFVKWSMDRLNGWEESLVIDPCCGTGSFLVEAYRRKIAAGKKPEEALKEVVGFDINPLAVVLSRAILFVSYLIAGGNKESNIVPYIFYADSALEFGDRLKDYRWTIVHCQGQCYKSHAIRNLILSTLSSTFRRKLFSSSHSIPATVF